MNRGRARSALLGRERGPHRAGAPAHLFPEFIEVVRRRGVGELALDRGREVVIGGAHVGEHRVAERFPVAVRDLDGVEHVGETDIGVIGQVGMPILPGVGQTDQLAVFQDIGEQHDLRHIRLAVGAGRRSLKGTELFRKRFQGARVEGLLGKADGSAAAERRQDGCKLRLGEAFRQIDIVNTNPEGALVRCELHGRYCRFACGLGFGRVARRNDCQPDIMKHVRIVQIAGRARPGRRLAMFRPEYALNRPFPPLHWRPV